MKEVTLLSLGPSRKECPFATDELWGVYRCILEPDLQDKKFDKLFCLDGIHQSINDHPPMEIKSITRSIERAKELGIPMVSWYAWATEQYPLKGISRRFGANYWGSTVSFMIAYALYYDYEKLHIYGIDQGPQLYYQTGKAPLCFWLGYARGLGVKIVMGRGSLRWTYSSGIGDLPFAWAYDEHEKFYLQTLNENERE